MTHIKWNMTFDTDQDFPPLWYKKPGEAEPLWSFIRLDIERQRKSNAKTADTDHTDYG